MAATFDRRRNQAPETSYAPVYEDLAGAGPSKRVDRAKDEARPIFLKTGLISQANGSGYIESGGVKIACSVYGPRAKQPPYTAQGTLNLEVKFAPFAAHPRRAPLRDTEPVNLSALLTQLLLPSLHLHLFPKSSIDVFLLVLEADSEASVLSAGLTVASAAVADAGIAMGGLGVGAVVAKVDDAVVIDPTDDEKKASTGTLSLGVMPAINKMTNLWLSGELDVNDTCSMIDQAVAAATVSHAALAQALVAGAEERQANEA